MVLRLYLNALNSVFQLVMEAQLPIGTQPFNIRQTIPLQELTLAMYESDTTTHDGSGHYHDDT